MTQGAIVTCLFGGLGNQMFQYAAARAIALRHNGHVLVDTSTLEGGRSHHGFELARVFAGSFPLASDRDLTELLGWRKAIRKLLIRRKLSWLPMGVLIVEPHFAYWPAIERATASCYLAGHWQSERYFDSVASVIRRDFQFSESNEANAKMGDTIRNASCAVSLHVRRGDYASNSAITALHGLCSISYYRNAVSYIESRHPGSSFFIFSDDLDWCARNLSLGPPTHFVNINRGADSFNDMRLMSMCRHHIIANSTFSWWGAWLDPSPEKIVIAPRNWFSDASQDASTIYPASWVRM